MQVPIRVSHNEANVSSMLVSAPAVLIVGRHSECQVRLEGDLVEIDPL